MIRLTDVVFQKNFLPSQDPVLKKWNENVLPFFDKKANFGTMVGAAGKSITYAHFSHPHPRATVLVATGWSENLLKYAEVIHDLFVAGYEVYAYDHRGQGLSQRLIGHPERSYVECFDDYVTDVEKLIESVIRPKTSGKIFGLAHSMGAMIYLLGMAYGRVPFDAVVLSSPMLAIRFGGMPTPVARALAFLGCTLRQGDAYAVLQKDSDPESPFEKNIVTRCKSRYAIGMQIARNLPQVRVGGVSYRWVKEALEGTDKVPKIPALLGNRPLLITQSEVDHVVRNDAQDTFAAACSNCTKIVYPNAKHELFMEIDETRNKVFADIFSFFEKHEK
jgi:lysophospholipase